MINESQWTNLLSFVCEQIATLGSNCEEENIAERQKLIELDVEQMKLLCEGTKSMETNNASSSN